MTTLSDVAKLAGVGMSTASYVINKTGLNKVGQDTQKRILDAAAELNYRPNIAGRALAKGLTFMAGAVFPVITGSFIAEILQGIEDVLNEKGYGLILSTYRSMSEYREKCLALLEKQIDGAIVLPCRGNERELEQIVRKLPLVIVAAESTVQSIPYVCVDGEKIAYLAVHLLLEKGHRCIAVQKSADPRRLQGAERAAREYPGARCMFFPSEGCSETDFLNWGMSLKPRPTAFLTRGDDGAVKLIGAAADAGLRVPDDISVIGVNGDEIGSWVRPSLTTVSQPKREQGVEAGKILLARIGRKPGRNMIFQPQLIERGSTGLCHR